MRRVLVLLVLYSSGAAAAELPVLDVDRWCASLGQYSGACVAREQQAYDLLRAFWDDFTLAEQAALGTHTSYQAMLQAAANGLRYRARALQSGPRHFQP